MLKDLAPTHLALCLATITPDGLDDLLKCFNLVNNGRGKLETTFPSLVYCHDDCRACPHFGLLAVCGSEVPF